MSRILIHDPTGEEAALPPFVAEGHAVITCKDRKTLVEEMSDRRPDVLVYLITDLAEDLGLLAVLRRVAPVLPIILLGRPTDLSSRRLIQELMPTYYGVLPLEGSELRDAIRGALQRAPQRR